MSKVLMESLKMDLPGLAELIRSKGRGKDTILAHITPKEAALLKKRGGSGTINPDTGLPEFDDFADYSMTGADAPAPVSPVYDVVSGGGGGGDNLGQYTYTPTIDPNLPNPRLDFSSGKDVVLPGEGGDISAYQPNIANAQPLLQTGPDATSYGFPNIPTSQLPPTIQSTPTLAELQALQVGGPQDNVPTAPGPATAAKDQSFLEKLFDPRTLAALGSVSSNLGRAAAGTAVAGGLTAANLARTRQAQQQAQQAQGELQAIGTPYQSQGKELLRAAQAGELTPASQQIVAAARAQANQGVATRGGVGALQAQSAIADLTNRLLQNQYDLGLKVMNIGDQYVTGAIKTGLQADQLINQANQQFYSSLAQMAAPFLLGQQPVYQVTTPRV